MHECIRRAAAQLSAQARLPVVPECVCRVQHPAGLLPRLKPLALHQLTPHPARRTPPVPCRPLASSAQRARPARVWCAHGVGCCSLAPGFCRPPAAGDHYSAIISFLGRNHSCETRRATPSSRQHISAPATAATAKGFCRRRPCGAASEGQTGSSGHASAT